MTTPNPDKITIRGCELTLKPMADNEHATDVIVLIRTERVTEEGRVVEGYEWSASPSAMAMRMGMAQLLKDNIADEDTE